MQPADENPTPNARGARDESETPGTHVWRLWNVRRNERWMYPHTGALACRMCEYPREDLCRACDHVDGECVGVTGKAVEQESVDVAAVCGARSGERVEIPGCIWRRLLEYRGTPGHVTSMCKPRTG